ncbi:MAG: tetratricopeptide repeat protein [Lysobacteraceae bacterium]
MTELWQRLKQRKLVQWAVAYVAATFALLQGIDIVAAKFGWPDSIERLLIIAACVGFFVALVLAWYHGEKGAQKASSTELMILALLLAIGGALMWHFAQSPVTTSVHAVTDTPSVAPDASQAATAAAEIPAKSIAVLPFENLSSDKDNAYFADGMQDLILTKLADISELKVISRTSTRKYASHPDDLKTIAQQLGVATILEGSVQKSGNQVLINVQLIDAKTDAHLWAETYQRTLDNVFGVEGEVAEQIATALKAKLSPAETAHLATALSTDPAANDLFLRAEYLALQGTMNVDFALVKQAIPLYLQAISKVPDFALARARLSHVESYLGFNGGAGEDVQQLAADARAQAEKALALAPDLVEAQLAIGYCDYYGRRDFAGALTTFDAVLKARPNDIDALAARGYVLRRMGRFEDARISLQQALAHDPRNSKLAGDVGRTYMNISRYSEAKSALQRALALDPNNGDAKLLLSQSIAMANGDLAGALAAAQGDAPPLQLWRTALLFYQRKYQDALALLASIPDTPENFPVGGRVLLQANLYRLAGDAGHARPLFEQALPLIRAQVKAQAGNVSYEIYYWSAVADAELGLGHTAAGLTAIAQAQALLSRLNDHVVNAQTTVSLAGLYAEADRPDIAVPLLDKALATPGIGEGYSPVLLRIDPTWDPIRHDPRFEALLKKYASAKPAAEVAP